MIAAALISVFIVGIVAELVLLCRPILAPRADAGV